MEEICTVCGKKFDNGGGVVIFGEWQCDSCSGTLRDRNGNAWDKKQITTGYKYVINYNNWNNLAESLLQNGEVDKLIEMGYAHREYWSEVKP